MAVVSGVQVGSTAGHVVLQVNLVGEQPIRAKISFADALGLAQAILDNIPAETTA